ncbi:hypothetical protein [Fodinibius halophilus]|nr:hypothetical protein [Fodinibius halophilus]
MDNLVEMEGLAMQAANDMLGEDEQGFIGEQIKKFGADINDNSLFCDKLRSAN